jgi:hypothetical protein
MLIFMRKNSGAFFLWPFLSAVVLSIWYAVNNQTTGGWSAAIFIGAVGFITILLLSVVNAYVKRKLPSDLKEKAWSKMSNEEFSRCGGPGVLGLLTGTMGVLVISFALGWLLSTATFFLFFSKGVA